MTGSPATPASTDTGMAWGIKRSLLRYLSALDDANVHVYDGAFLTSGQEFYFPVTEIAYADEEAATPAEVRFGGSVSILGHFGALAVEIRNPVLRMNAGLPTAQLWSTAAGADSYHLADVDLGPAVSDGGILMWHAAPTLLAAAAVALFGGAYAPGEPMDPVTLRIPAVPAPR